MAENFKINVGVAFTIEDYSDKMNSGGDVNSASMTLTYHNGDGVSFVADQVLYTEGAIGGPDDFFQIKSVFDVDLSSSGTFIIILTVQTNLPAGTVVPRTISVGGSLPFTFTVQYQ